MVAVVMIKIFAARRAVRWNLCKAAFAKPGRLSACCANLTESVSFENRAVKYSGLRAVDGQAVP